MGNVLGNLAHEQINFILALFSGFSLNLHPPSPTPSTAKTDKPTAHCLTPSYPSVRRACSSVHLFNGYIPSPPSGIVGLITALAAMGIVVVVAVKVFKGRNGEVVERREEVELEHVYVQRVGWMGVEVGMVRYVDEV